MTSTNVYVPLLVCRPDSKLFTCISPFDSHSRPFGIGLWTSFPFCRWENWHTEGIGWTLPGDKAPRLFQNLVNGFYPPWVEWCRAPMECWCWRWTEEFCFQNLGRGLRILRAGPSDTFLTLRVLGPSGKQSPGMLISSSRLFVCQVVCQVLGGSKIWSIKPHFELQEISIPEGRRKEADHFKCCVSSTMEDVTPVGH